jgi:hypothetical protein
LLDDKTVRIAWRWPRGTLSFVAVHDDNSPVLGRTQVGDAQLSTLVLTCTNSKKGLTFRVSPDVRRFVPSGVVIAEHDRAVAALGGAHALAELGQVVVDIDNFTFGGSSGDLVVATSIQGHPAAAEVIHATYLVPRHPLADRRAR